MRDILFSGKISRPALIVLAVIALMIGLVGGWVGRKSAEVIEAFMIPKMTLNTADTDHLPQSQMGKVAAAVADSVVTVQAISDSEGSQGQG